MSRNRGNISRVAIRRPKLGWAGLVVVWCVSLAANGQTLNLPPRPLGAPDGTQFTNIVTTLSLTERERWIYAQVISGNVPAWLRNLTPISVTAGAHTATYHALPDYLAIGGDTNYFLCPMTPILAQRLADRLGCTLPTRKMANQIWTNALVKMNPRPIDWSPEMTTVPVFAWHDYMVRTQRNSFTNTFPPGALTGGHKKDVIISARIYTNFANAGITKPVVIYGWHYPSGSPIQPLYNGHEETYADYSHGIRLAQLNLTVNGSSNTVTNVLTSASLAPLLSDDGASEGSTTGTIPLPRYTVAPLAPVVMMHPRNRSVTAGEPLTLQTLAIGDLALTYQWRLQGTNLPNATHASLILSNVQPAHAGQYSVVASNLTGSATSRVAVVRVNSLPPPMLFADDFETNTATNWNVVWGAANGIPDFTVDWVFDYSAIPYTFNGVTTLIPPAPNSPDGSTRAVRLTVNNNDAIGATAAVNLYPKHHQFSGDFALKFDLWINYPGNAGGTGSGVTGSTEHAIFGVNHRGTNANWAAPAASTSDGLWFAAVGEGGDSRDYRAYEGNPAGLAFDLTSTLDATNHNSASFQSLFPVGRFETPGAPGKNWIEVEVRYTTNIVTWLMEGTVIARRTNTSSFTSGTVMIGLMDTFNSIASPARDSFVLFDNLRVADLSPYPVRFDSVARLTNGGVQLMYRGVPDARYALQVTDGLPATNWQTLATLVAGKAPTSFVDTNATAAPRRFYRLKQ